MGVAERMCPDGTVEEALYTDAFREAVRVLKAEGVKSVAVSFLYSFLNAEHEKTTAAILAEEFPEAFVAILLRIAPESRE